MSAKDKLINSWVVSIVLLVAVFVFGIECVNVSAAETNLGQEYTREVEVSQAFITKYGFTNAFYRTIEMANAASSLENESGSVKVTMPAGTYEISNPIQVNYSNLTVDFRGCTFIQKKDNVGNLLKIGESNSKRTGYAYHDITIIGGVFDGNGSKSTIFKTAHSKNIKVIGTTFKNVTNGHLTEAAGVDGLTFSECNFENQMLGTSGATLTYEAIQLDILTHEHFSGYMAEALPTKNVLVEKCVFDQVPRGVGSHTGILNCPMDGITIRNNTFKNIGSIAVQGFNWINVSISDNDISDCPRGIALYAMQNTGMYLQSDIAAEDGAAASISDEYVKPADNQNIIISGNKIVCGGKDQFADYAPVAIYVGGLKLSKNTKMTKGSVIPKGDYFISGVTIKNNQVQSVGNGIRLEDVRKVTVSSNQFKFIGKQKGDIYHGIQLRLASQADSIKSNTISGYNANGIYLNTSSKAKLISGNKISNVGKYGIGVEQSTVTTIKSNTIKKAKLWGIAIVIKSKVSKISGNKISGCTEKIHITKDSKA
ncbi:MAG: right-handed parallel beta-helix repeat-containing protein [bacterium]|nr:right-handed parallel beta-helix repeat-containing protein [bacterium]